MEKLDSLQQFFADRPAMAIAVSGGVDSMTLAVVAHRAKAGTQVFHAISPAVPVEATERVKTHAEKEGWHLNIIDAGEIHDPEYVANPANRCYFCKTNLYDTVTSETTLTVASGTNLDDLGDYRPGLIAAEEHQVCHPYVEVGIDKTGLREIAASLGLDDLKDLPAAPCLSSRVTTGIAIDSALLPLINEAEKTVWGLLEDHIELLGVRCRILPGEVAIQVETPGELNLVEPRTEEIVTVVTRLFIDAGYADQVGDVRVEPYRKGSAFLIETLEVK